MTRQQEQAVDNAFSFADDHDKSTEWALQYAADRAHCSVDAVCEYLYEKSEAVK